MIKLGWKRFAPCSHHLPPDPSPLRPFYWLIPTSARNYSLSLITLAVGLIWELKDNGRAKLRNRNGNLQQKISAALHMVRIRTEGMGGWLLVRFRLGQRRVCLGSLVCHGMPALGDTDRAYLPSVTQPLSFPPLTPPCSTFLLRILCTAESLTRTASPDLIELSWLRGRGEEEIKCLWFACFKVSVYATHFCPNGLSNTHTLLHLLEIIHYWKRLGWKIEVDNWKTLVLMFGADNPKDYPTILP